MLERGHFLDFIIPDFLETRRQGPVLVFGSVRAVLCDGPMCSEDVKEDICVHNSDLKMVYLIKGYIEGAAFLCDYCGLPGTSGQGAQVLQVSHQRVLWRGV